MKLFVSFCKSSLFLVKHFTQFTRRNYTIYIYLYIYNTICTLPSAHMFTYIHIHIQIYTYIYTYTYKNDREKTGIRMSRHQMFRLFQTYPLYLNKTYFIKVENNICLPTPIVPLHTYKYKHTYI